MKRTYTQTTFIEDLPSAIVTLYCSDICKYIHSIPRTEKRKIQYIGLTSWDIVEGGREAEELEATLSPEKIDDHHEYLILHFEDGSEEIFRNSYVDMFID